MPAIEASGPRFAVPDSDEEARRLKKELKRIEDARRPLDSWERYRALNDAVREGYDLIDIANREARFALLVLGGLNAALFVLASRGELVAALPGALRPWIGFALIGYGVVAVYFFVQAIETLRPRRQRPRLQPSAGFDEDHPAGLRYFEDVAGRDVAEHCRAWRDVRIDQLNADLAVQAHNLSVRNLAKYSALRRLYAGLRVITLIVAALLLLLGFFAFRSVS